MNIAECDLSYALAAVAWPERVMDDSRRDETLRGGSLRSQRAHLFSTQPRSESLSSESKSACEWPSPTELSVWCGPCRRLGDLQLLHCSGASTVCFWAARLVDRYAREHGCIVKGRSHIDRLSHNSSLLTHFCRHASGEDMCDLGGALGALRRAVERGATSRQEHQQDADSWAER